MSIQVHFWSSRHVDASSSLTTVVGREVEQSTAFELDCERLLESKPYRCGGRYSSRVYASKKQLFSSNFTDSLSLVYLRNSESG